MTSSPAPIPWAMSARRSASVPDAQPTARVVPQYAATSFSNSATLGPLMKIWDSTTSWRTGSISCLML